MTAAVQGWAQTRNSEVGGLLNFSLSKNWAGKMGPWVNTSGAKLDIQDPYGKKKCSPEMFGSLQN